MEQMEKYEEAGKQSNMLKRPLEKLDLKKVSFGIK